MSGKHLISHPCNWAIALLLRTLNIKRIISALNSKLVWRESCYFSFISVLNMTQRTAFLTSVLQMEFSKSAASKACQQLVKHVHVQARMLTGRCSWPRRSRNLAASMRWYRTLLSIQLTVFVGPKACHTSKYTSVVRETELKHALPLTKPLAKPLLWENRCVGIIGNYYRNSLCQLICRHISWIFRLSMWPPALSVM